MHETYISRCIEIARQGIGNVQPNPMVGCIIVHNEKIIGEGYHQKIGEAHAEVNAINSVSDRSLLKNSRLYVNLEPCAHYGKTPPCAELIAKLKIPEVYIGTIDPFTKVKGKGIEILKNAGCKVHVGFLEDECNELNKRFFTFHNKKRPYIILKWAETKDGFIDIIREKNCDKKPNWITNETARALVHRWRSEEQAIIVGKKTVEFDNPKLNVRNWTGADPLRILITNKNDLSKDHHICDKSQPTLIYNLENSSKAKNLEFIRLDRNADMILQLLTDLYKRDIQSLIVEGGAELLNSFIKADLWDEARVFEGDIFFKDGISGPRLVCEPIDKEVIGNSTLSIFRNL